MNADIVRPSFTDTIPWRVVIERTGTHRLHTIFLRADMPIKTVMEEIITLYQREQPWWFRRLSHHVEIATIVSTCGHAMWYSDLGTDRPSSCSGLTDNHIAHRRSH